MMFSLLKKRCALGVKGIFTAHGEGKKELTQNPVLSELLAEQIIEKVIFIRKDRCIALE